jgi:L-lactate dehydrogenase (cytochrome)
MVSSNASISPATIIASAFNRHLHTSSSAPLFYQLYKHRSNVIAAERVREIERLGYKAIWLTVDAVVPGNRERDVKSAWEGSSENISNAEVDMGGTAGKFLANGDVDMTWEEVGRDSTI